MKSPPFRSAGVWVWVIGSARYSPNHQFCACRCSLADHTAASLDQCRQGGCYIRLSRVVYQNEGGGGGVLV